MFRLGGANRITFAEQAVQIGSNQLHRRRRSAVVQVCFSEWHMHCTGAAKNRLNARKCRSSSLRRRPSARKFFKVAVENYCSKMLVSVRHMSIPLYGSKPRNCFVSLVRVYAGFGHPSSITARMSEPLFLFYLSVQLFFPFLFRSRLFPFSLVMSK